MSKMLRFRLELLSFLLTAFVKRPNDGGCCVVASKVSKALTILGVSHKIRIRAIQKQSLTEVRKKINCKGLDKSQHINWYKNGAKFNHVMVQIGDQLFDSNGFVSVQSQREHLSGGVLTQKEAENFANSAEGWNVLFDRNQIPRITKLTMRTLTWLNY